MAVMGHLYAQIEYIYANFEHKESQGDAGRHGNFDRLVTVPALPAVLREALYGAKKLTRPKRHIEPQLTFKTPLVVFAARSPTGGSALCIVHPTSHCAGPPPSRRDR